MFRRTSLSLWLIAAIATPLWAAIPVTVSHAPSRLIRLTVDLGVEQASTRPTFTLIVKDSFSSSGVSAMIRRTKGLTGEDVIAVRRNAITPELIRAAFSSLAKSRARHGESPNETVLVRLRDATQYGRLSLSERTLYVAIIQQLKNAPVRDVSDFGRVPAISFPANTIATGQ